MRIKEQETRLKLHEHDDDDDDDDYHTKMDISEVGNQGGDE